MITAYHLTLTKLLAWGRCVNRVKLTTMFVYKFNGVFLMKFKRVMWLRFDVYPNNIEPDQRVTHASTAGTTECI